MSVHEQLFEPSLSIGSAPTSTGGGTPQAVSLVPTFSCKMSFFPTIVTSHLYFGVTILYYVSCFLTPVASSDASLMSVECCQLFCHLLQTPPCGPNDPDTGLLVLVGSGSLGGLYQFYYKSAGFLWPLK